MTVSEFVHAPTTVFQILVQSKLVTQEYTGLVKMPLNRVRTLFKGQGNELRNITGKWKRHGLHRCRISLCYAI
jgi:hypothetical protein